LLIATEEVVQLKRARQLFSSRPSDQTLKRWCRFGCLNRSTGQIVRLEHFRIAGRFYTSRQAVERYLEAMSEE
jgi:hypothetical protein